MRHTIYVIGSQKENNNENNNDENVHVKTPESITHVNGIPLDFCRIGLWFWIIFINKYLYASKAAISNIKSTVLYNNSTKQKFRPYTSNIHRFNILNKIWL